MFWPIVNLVIDEVLIPDSFGLLKERAHSVTETFT